MRHTHVTMPPETASAILSVSTSAQRLASAARFVSVSRKARVRLMADARKVEQRARAIRVQLAACV